MRVGINGLQINFHCFGSGQPVVILHGWGDDSRSWYPLAESLSAHRQVVLLDLPGFGASDLPPHAWGMADYSNAVASFCNELELSHPVVAGHSHGGKIACHLAATTSLCKGLILVSPSGATKRSLLVQAKIAAYKAAKLALNHAGQRGKHLLSRAQQALGSSDYGQAGAMRPSFIRLVNETLFPLLPGISIPTLIIWGSEDKTLPLETSKVFRSAVPNSYIRVVWGAGHFPHLEARDELAEIFNEYFSNET